MIFLHFKRRSAGIIAVRPFDSRITIYQNWLYGVRHKFPVLRFQFTMFAILARDALVAEERP